MKRHYEIDHRFGQSNITCRGVKLGSFYSAEMAEYVLALLNEHPPEWARPKAPPTPEVFAKDCQEWGID